MKVIICDKSLEKSEDYFKRAWRIPFEELEKNDWISINPVEINKKPSEFFMEKYNELPLVILFWLSYKFVNKYFEDIIEHNWIKCFYIDDIHPKEDYIWKHHLRINMNKHFDYIFSTYAYIYPKFFPQANINKIIWYPHNINHNFKIPFNTNPLNKILLSGAINQKYYPFREKVRILAQNKNNQIDILKPLTYTFPPKHEYFGKNYIKHLNQYLVGITCCSTNTTPYLLNKFFEIPGSGALLLAFDEHIKEQLNILGFIDGQNYISVNNQNLTQKIDYVLDNKNRNIIDKIRKEGYDLVWERHTLLHRINIIENTLNNN